jgi:hypothetical protein
MRACAEPGGCAHVPPRTTGAPTVARGGLAQLAQELGRRYWAQEQTITPPTATCFATPRRDLPPHPWPFRPNRGSYPGSAGAVPAGARRCAGIFCGPAHQGDTEKATTRFWIRWCPFPPKPLAGSCVSGRRVNTFGTPGSEEEAGAAAAKAAAEAPATPPPPPATRPSRAVHLVAG